MKTAKMQRKLDWSDVAALREFLNEPRVSSAARKRGTDPTTLVRRLRRLERALGVTLIENRDGRLAPAEAAAALLPSIEAMAEAADQLIRSSQQQQGPSGTVRLTAIRSVIARLIVPNLKRFRMTYPDIEMELISESRNLSLSRREADLAIRLALPTGQGLVTCKLADIGFAVYEAKTTPRHRSWLAYTEDMDQLPEAQWLERHRGAETIILRANGVETLTAAALKGLGKAVLPCFVGDTEPGLRRLSKVPDLTREAWLAVHAEDRRTARVRTVMDFVIACFKDAQPAMAGRKVRSSQSP